MKAPVIRASHQGVPPHLLHPAPGDVPVVVDVVVVEDHRRRHRREQPADVGVRPRLSIEARVLLEVGDLLAGRLVRVAAARMNSSVAGETSSAYTWSPRSRSRVGPLGLAALQQLRVRPECVDARRSPGHSSRAPGSATDPARAEDEPNPPLVVARVNGRARPPVVRRPHQAPSSRTSYGVTDAGWRSSTRSRA